MVNQLPNCIELSWFLRKIAKYMRWFQQFKYARCSLQRVAGRYYPQGDFTDKEGLKCYGYNISVDHRFRFSSNYRPATTMPSYGVENFVLKAALLWKPENLSRRFLKPKKAMIHFTNVVGRAITKAWNHCIEILRIPTAIIRLDSANKAVCAGS